MRATGARAIWFGPPGRPLFGWLHLPAERRARAGVVLCPPLGIQALSAYAGQRALAERLEEAGYLVLRFDHDGTGNSSGSGPNGARLGSWVAGIAQAAALLREAGAADLALVGTSFGANLAAEAAARVGGFGALVLWAPWADGRQFLRSQQILRAVYQGDEPASLREAAEGPLELLGIVLSRQTADELAGLGPPAPGLPLARRVLLVEDASRPAPPRLLRRLASEHLDRVTTSDLDVFAEAMPDAAGVPEESLGVVTRWLEAALPGDDHEVRPVGRAVGLVGPDVTEQAVRMGSLGLFGVLSEPTGPVRGPTVVFLSAGLIHHVGPGRLWVELGRALAARGVPALRVDISGVGESPVRAAQTARIVHPIEALEDVRMVVADTLARNPAGVVLSGLCAGAYHAIECAEAEGVRGVCAINPILQFDPPEAPGEASGPNGRRAVRPFPRWIRPFLAHQRLAARAERTVPAGLWWVLEHLGLFPTPVSCISALAKRGLLVVLLCGETDALQFTRRGRGEMRRLLRTGEVHLEVIPAIDHSLFGADARRRTADTFLDQFLSVFVDRHAPEDRPAAPAHRFEGSERLDGAEGACLHHPLREGSPA